MTNNKKNWVDEILGDVSKSSATKQIVLGTTSGWLTGFVTMKVGKVAAVAVGGGILILQVALHKGYIKINWDKIQRSADNLVNKIESETTETNEELMEKVDVVVSQSWKQTMPKTREKYLSRVDALEGKAKKFLKSQEKKARRWYHSFINNNGHGGYQLQELHLFLASFAAGLSFGFATA